MKYSRGWGSWEQRFMSLTLFLPLSLHICFIFPFEDRQDFLLWSTCDYHTYLLVPFRKGPQQSWVRDSKFQFSEEIADWPTLVRCLSLTQSAMPRGGPSGQLPD